MKIKKITTLSLLILLTFPLIIFGQNIHQQIREMEQARFEKMQTALFSQSLKTDQSGFDVHFYRIELEVDPTEQTIGGNVVVSAKATIDALNQITLDFYDNMAIDSITSNSTSLNFTRDSNQLTIDLPNNYNIDESFTVTVFYNGHPVPAGGFASFTFRQHEGAPIISTLSQPFGAPTWWPCKDNPADKVDSVDIIITVPDTLVVASNGKLTSEIQNVNNTKTFHWEERYPISTYLVSLAISNYEVFKDYYLYGANDSMEVVYYVYPEDYTNAVEDFSVTVDMIEYFSSVFGQYPFIEEKYGMAEFPWGGAMEHQTCTSYGEDLITGNHFFDYINAHELAHQWFGDLITIKSWAHIWLNEGFASYSEALWTENIEGEQGLLDYMAEFDQGLFPTSVFVYDSLDIGELFSRTVYDKGAWVLHMLRHVMGDTTFFNALVNYRNTFSFSNATTEDFRDICEIEYGGDLDWFFDEWVYGMYRPNYEYVWTDSTIGNDHLITLTLEQVQTNTGLFKMPLDVVISTFSGDTTFVIWDSLESQTFEFLLNEEPTNLLIDPDGWVLKILLHDETISVSGTVYGGDEFTPLEGAELYFSRINLDLNTVVSTDIAVSDDQGQYSISVHPGFFIIEALHFDGGYLPMTPKYMEINHNTTGLDLTLISPAISTNKDSIYVFLDQGETYTDSLQITNQGSGQLIFSVAPTSDDGTPAQSPNFQPGIPRTLIPDKTFITSTAKPHNLRQAAAPTTASWQLLYQDPVDNVDGVFDINQIRMKVENGNLYLNVTTHQPFGSLSQFEYDLAIDVDNNPNTGLFTGWLGVEYIIAISDFGGAYSVLVKWVNDTFVLETFAIYENFNPANNELTVAFPLSSFGPVKALSMFAQVINLSDQFLDHDTAPDQNLGYFIFGTEDIPWLNIEPNFGLVGPAESNSVILNINPDAISAGHYNVNLVIGNNEFVNIKKIIPIKFDYITGVTEELLLPKAFSLSQNYPNPFNSETLICYELPERGNVKIDVYNLLGQNIRRLISKKQAAGSYSVQWDGRDQSGKLVGSGVYFYTIQLDNSKLPVKKMVILK